MGGGGRVALLTRCEIRTCKISDDSISCRLLFVLGLFLFFIKSYADDDGISAASSAQALAASMLKKKEGGTPFSATTP